MAHGMAPIRPEKSGAPPPAVPSSIIGLNRVWCAPDRDGQRAVQDIRPDRERRFEVRFETPPGEQAQVDFARFEVVFADEPSTRRIVWLFSMVLGFSRLIWARFVVHQDLQSVLRCHASPPSPRSAAHRGRSATTA
jgi:transposase